MHDSGGSCGAGDDFISNNDIDATIIGGPGNDVIVAGQRRAEYFLILVMAVIL